MSVGDEPAGAHVDAVVHRVHRALVAADTRADLESASCRAFVGDEPYALAWIGVHDDATDRIVPTASAGEDASYLDGLAIRVHDAPTATEPSATALKTATTQVRRRLRTDPDAEPWRDRALAHGFESSIAIPLVTDWVAYGVLSLYSRRPDAFDDGESALLTELGETIATAIVGIEARTELEAQRDGLDLLNEVVRHDIRNTLQVISGYGDLLEPHVDADGADHLRRILTSAQSATELTHTAADLAEVMLERRRERTSVPLAETLEAQIADVETTFGPASITVDGSLPQVRVLADGMLPSVFRNLLKNAIQHNDAASPEVVVSAVADGETVTVRVADNGPGVPEHLRSTIFAQGAKGLASGGTGIGLYLVRTLVEAYGGSVALEDSESGAVFAVELPAA